MRKILIIFGLLSCLFLFSCKKSQITVKFLDINNDIIEEVTFYEDSSFNYPAPPSVMGYRFVKWEIITNDIEEQVYKAVYEKLTYVVTIYDLNNNVISVQNISHGENADIPKYDFNVEGHIHTGFDKDLNNITSDLDVYPIYDAFKFTVNFYDALGEVISSQIVEYGKDAVLPTEPENDGALFIGWDKDHQNITQDLDIYPIYEVVCYEVSFYDHYGNLLSSECIKHGSSANPPKVLESDYYTFVRWDQDFSNVTSNLIVNAIVEENNISYNMSDYNYWLNLLSKKTSIYNEIMSFDEIGEFNNNVYSTYSKTKVVDFRNIYKKEYGSDIEKLITNYSSINKYTIYDPITYSAITSSQKEEILNNRNIENIPNIVEAKFGIVTSFAHIRSYPTNCHSDSSKMDRFQETSLNVGDGVVIYHESKDGLWYFVQGYNYNGWILKENVGTCSYDDMIDFLYSNDRVVILKDHVINMETIRMGQSLPVNSSNEENVYYSFPTRDIDGSLLLIEISEVNNSSTINRGYLTFNYDNLFKLAFSLLGNSYSWGDFELLGRDCSSTMNSIYQCFGFVMPRNTSNQRSVPSFSSNISGLTVSSIKTYNPGTLVFTSSHVMMYIGCDVNGNPYLLHNTNKNDSGCILQSFESYGGSKMIGVLKFHK